MNVKGFRFHDWVETANTNQISTSKTFIMANRVTKMKTYQPTRTQFDMLHTLIRELHLVWLTKEGFCCLDEWRGNLKVENAVEPSRAKSRRRAGSVRVSARSSQPTEGQRERGGWWWPASVATHKPLTPHPVACLCVYAC